MKQIAVLPAPVVEPAPPTALVVQNAELIALARTAGTEVRDLEAERMHVITALAGVLAPILHEAKLDAPQAVRLRAWPFDRCGDVQFVGRSNSVTLYLGVRGRLVLRQTHRDPEHFWEWNPNDRVQDYAITVLELLVARTATIQAELLKAVEFRRNSRGALDDIAGAL